MARTKKISPTPAATGTTAVSINPQKGRWTLEYATVLHLLFAAFDDPDRNTADPEVVVKVFRYLFANDLPITHPNTGGGNSLTDDNLVDYYKSSHLAGRGKIFEGIKTANPAPEQVARINRLTPMVKSAINQLGLDDLINEKAATTSAPASAQTGEQDEDHTVPGDEQNSAQDAEQDEGDSMPDNQQNSAQGDAQQDVEMQHANFELNEAGETGARSPTPSHAAVSTTPPSSPPLQGRSIHGEVPAPKDGSVKPHNIYKDEPTIYAEPRLSTNAANLNQIKFAEGVMRADAKRRKEQ